jgi:hydrogenase maturation protease
MRPRPDLLLVGVGHPLRGDDRVGLEVVRRLSALLGPGLDVEEAYEADILLAERMSHFREVLVVDAAPANGDGAPFHIVGLAPGPTAAPRGGFVSHVFDWGALLALARDLFGRCPEARLLAVAATAFELSEELSPPCERAAEEALRFLARYCVTSSARSSAARCPSSAGR